MIRPQQIIAVDIGNTNTKIGLVNRDTLTCAYGTRVTTNKLLSELPNAVRLCLRHSTVHPVSVILCSVVNVKKDAITRMLTDIPDVNQVSFFTHATNLPITIAYTNPATLGSDRLANCLYAMHKRPLADCIIISCGTAVTIDAFSAQRIFLGGYILPGIQTQLNSLHDNTSQLPLVTAIPDHFATPPVSTTDAITGGVCLGLAGGITTIVALLGKLFNNEHEIFACGGGWQSLIPLVNFHATFVPDLTLIGIGLYDDYSGQ